MQVTPYEEPGSAGVARLDIKLMGNWIVRLWDHGEMLVLKRYNVDVRPVGSPITQRYIVNEFYPTLEEAQHVYDNPEPTIFLCLATGQTQDDGPGS